MREDTGRGGRSLTLSALILLLIWGPAGQAAEKRVGSVVFAKGVVTAQIKGAEARFLGKGEPLFERDVLSTGKKSFTVIQMTDGSRMTLRARTVLGLEKYAHGKKEESALLRLFRGGLRAITGLISKRNPRRGYRLRTPVATIGIRGTEFDARLCGEDCKAESSKRGQAAPGGARSPVVARIAYLRGRVTAQGADAKSRRVLKGAAIYQGDTLESAPGGIAVLVFQDNSRVTLKPKTRFKVEQFRYRQGKKDGLLLRLFRGGLRALTGLIGRKNRKAFRLNTPVATIGIRGTGFDINCEGSCASEEKTVDVSEDVRDCPAGGGPAHAPAERGSGLIAYTWDGTIELRGEGCKLLVEKGHAAYLKAGTGTPQGLRSVPKYLIDSDAPRPDRLDVDLEEMFGAVEQAEPQEGVYVSVYDGNVVLETKSGSIDLGVGESGYAGGLNKRPVRLARQPLFQVYDPVPKPSEIDERVERILDFIGEDFGAGAEQCEIR